MNSTQVKNCEPLSFFVIPNGNNDATLSNHSLPEIAAPNDRPILRFADLELNTNSYTVKRGNKKLHLQLRQLKLLHYMMCNHGRILSETELINKVWRLNCDELKSRVLSACMSQLRRQIDKDFEKKLIHNKRGLGYILYDED